jgi:hypothetical protein
MIEGVGKTEIMTRNAHVILRVNDGMEYQMHLVDNKTFYIPGYDQWISFHSLKNGRYNYINWNSTMLQTTGKRISK